MDEMKMRRKCKTHKSVQRGIARQMCTKYDDWMVKEMEKPEHVVIELACSVYRRNLYINNLLASYF